MAWAGQDIVVEVVRLVLLLGATVFLWVRGRRTGLGHRPGWWPLMAGLWVLSFHAAYDLSDEFQATTWRPVLGGMDVQDTLEDLVLPVLGTALLGLGVVRWLDLPARLSAREQELRDLNASLEGRVEVATAELERTNAALSLSEERFRLISKATHDTTWDLNLETGELWWGKGLEARFGWPLQKIGSDLGSWTERIHEADQERVVQGFDEAIEAGRPRWRDSYRFQRADGSYAHVLDHAYIQLDEEGRAARVVGSMIDITERVSAQKALEEADQRFHTLVNCIDETYWIVDATSLEVTYISAGFEKVFGLPYEALPTPEAWLELVHPEDRGWLPSAMVEAFEAYQELSLPYRIVWPDGSIRWVETVIRPVEDPDGQVRTIAGVTRDITPRVEAEEAREAAIRHQAEAERLREIDQFKTRFLNTAAHELSTPLTPLRLQVKALHQGFLGELSPQQRESLEIIERNIERFGRLTKDLLDGTRLEAGQLRIDPVETPLCQLVENLAREIGVAAKEFGVELETEIEPGCNALVDPTRIEQVVGNLADNALKFTPAGGRVVLRVRPLPEGVRLEVEDTGVGLTDDQLERLFQPFSQVHDTDRGVQTGTGLGLYICKGIVEQHRGTIRAESAGRDQGTRFVIDLPRDGPWGADAKGATGAVA